MKTKLNKAFDIFEKIYFYTIGAVIAICVAWGLIDAVKVAFVAAPWFWVILGVGTLYVAFVGLLMYLIHKYFPSKKVAE